MKKMDINIVEESFFRKGNPLKKLLKISLSLFDAEQTGILFGTNETNSKFLPTSMWNRGIMDKFDGRGLRGWILKYFGAWIVTAKKLSPVFFFTISSAGEKKINHGVISYVLRNYADYYKKGISVLICPYSITPLNSISQKYMSIPLYCYDGLSLKMPDEQIKIDTRIVKQFNSKNSIFIYLPSYGILVINTADENLLEMDGHFFVNEAELKHRLDILIRLVETASLAYLGQLKGKRGAQLLWRKERHLRETSAQLIENEERYRDLYENAPNAYFSMDNTGMIIRGNKQAEFLSGYPQHELKGKNVIQLLANKMEMSQKRNYIIQSIKEDLPIKDMELLITHKEGTNIWISLSIEAVKDKFGQVIELRAMAQDISRRKNLEKQLLHAQKMEAIGTLSRGIAHDFNNILAPIYGYTQILLMDMEEDTLLKKNLEIIQNCSVHARDLVQQMLSFSKQHVDDFTPVQVKTSVQQAMDLFRSFLPATISLEVDINPACEFVLGDPVQINQVVMNLVTNAIHAMEDNGGKLKIVLDQQTIDTPHVIDPKMMPGSYVHLMVSDTGSGIDETIVGKIFDPYFSTKQEGKGSGIGLSVVHGIVKSHEGYIRVESDTHKGTQFHIYFPVYNGPVDIRTSEVHPDKIIKGAGNILLVEDDKAVAYMVEQMLEKLGYKVTCHTDSLKGYEAFSNSPEHYDVVVTDLTMPHMNGIDLAKKIFQKRPDIPVVLCTGFGEGINTDARGTCGIKVLLKKPVAIKEFSHILHNILEKNKA